MSSARRLLTELRERSQSGLRSLAWAALPCTPWCCWHRLNYGRATQEEFARLEQARADSVKLIHIFVYVVNT
eukprot:11744409-Heterocapsa_arctica.AAC.1